jgi:hypothetical protein
MVGLLVVCCGIYGYHFEGDNIARLVDEFNDLFMPGTPNIHSVYFEQIVAWSKPSSHCHSRHVNTLEELKRRDIQIGFDV